MFKSCWPKHKKSKKPKEQRITLDHLWDLDDTVGVVASAVAITARGGHNHDDHQHNENCVDAGVKTNNDFDDIIEHVHTPKVEDHVENCHSVTHTNTHVHIPKHIPNVEDHHNNDHSNSHTSQPHHHNNHSSAYHDDNSYSYNDHSYGNNDNSYSHNDHSYSCSHDDYT